MIFTVPALSLVDQTVRAFWEDGIRDVGVMQGTHAMTDWSRPVQVASVQTLQRRPIPEADVVMIDECHRWYDFYGNWMKDLAWQNRPFIGLSATPWTRGLGQYFDDLVIAATTQDLIAEGYLSPFRVFAPSHPDLTDVRTVAGDYHEGDLSGVMSDTPLVADVVDTWRRRAENRSTFCFAVDRAHAKHLQEEIRRSRRFNGLHRRLHADQRAVRDRTEVSQRRNSSGVQRRMPNDRHRLGRALHRPRATNQVRDSVRADYRSRIANRRRQGRLLDPRSLRHASAAWLRDRHPPRSSGRRTSARKSEGVWIVSVCRKNVRNVHS